jgi:adenylosuccinate synthase
MAAVVIVGAQWGDEGKGKIVDLYAERADVVVRYAGGPNAGHTLVVGEDKLIVRLLPSGVLRPKVRCVLAQGMAVDPAVLVEEIDALARRGVSCEGRLSISGRAHLILPHHRLVDGLREAAAEERQKIGTTKKGIGPCYEDKAARRGVRLGDLRNEPRVREQVARTLEAWRPTIEALGGAVPSASEVADELIAGTRPLMAMIADTSAEVEQAIRSGKRVMMEGAQGTLLDLDHGTYPFVTSSSAVAGGACTGIGIGPTRIDRVVGITKAYTTRVGAGPFPTEL